MRAAVDRLGQTVVMVTHDAKAAAYADRVLFLADGRVVRRVGRADDRHRCSTRSGRSAAEPMFRITLGGLLAHKVRYALTALAVLLGVAFMAGTLVLTDTIGRTFDGLFADIYRGTSAVVRAPEAFTTGSQLHQRSAR